MIEEQFLIAKGSGGGGLGDSIKSLLTAALYAELSGRTLVVDWRGGVYSDGVNDPFDSVLELAHLTYQAALPDSDSVYPPAWHDRIKQSLHEVYTDDGWSHWDRAKVIERYSFDLANPDYPHDILIMWEFDQAEKLLGYFPQIHDLNALFRYAAHRFLRPVPSLRSEMADTISKFSRPIVGVHFRATQEFFDSKGGVSAQQYFKRLERIVQRESVSDIFLATDNADIEKQLHSRYPRLRTIQKRFADAGQPLHLNTPEAIKQEGLREAILDMLLLAECDHLLINPTSSFAQAARYFSSIDEAHIHSVLTPSLKQRLLSWLGVRAG